MRHYEIVILVHPDQSEQVSGMIERYRKMVASSGGQVHREEDWGRRILAYMISDVHKAHYVMLNVECDLSTIREVEGHFRFNDSILRHLIIRRKKAIVEQSPILKAKIREDEAEKLSREREMREALENPESDDSKVRDQNDVSEESVDVEKAGVDVENDPPPIAEQAEVDNLQPEADASDGKEQQANASEEKTQ